MVKITANGTLNMYIAVDMSESITKENITGAKTVIEKLVSKVRRKQFSWLKMNKNTCERFSDILKNSQCFS